MNAIAKSCDHLMFWQISVHFLLFIPLVFYVFENVFALKPSSYPSSGAVTYKMYLAYALVVEACSGCALIVAQSGTGRALCLPPLALVLVAQIAYC